MSLPPFILPAWAKGAHAQTVLGRYWPWKKDEPVWSKLRYEKLRVVLNDGDVLMAEIWKPDDPTTAIDQVVYLFHGLGGSSQSAYIPRSAQRFLSQGRCAVILGNHRGCGIGEGLAKSPYHSGRAEDLSAIITEGRRIFPSAHHLAIGFSLSGNALLLLLGARQNLTLPDAAISVNAPIDLARASVLLQKGFSRVYDFRFVLDAKREISKRFQQGLLDQPIPISWTAVLADVDDLYVAPRSGFQDRHDYYARCSAMPHLGKIQIPTALLTSDDDPFVDVASYRSARLSSSSQLHIVRGGGHMGYLSAREDAKGSRHWLDQGLVALVAQLKAGQRNSG
ncbi:MAG: alpha/beta fold hydrolase [Bdellovibrionales bacterium]|nr:alpha/beta fold hydrolase [Bdellovibrionales bacterium]